MESWLVGQGNARTTTVCCVSGPLAKLKLDRVFDDCEIYDRISMPSDSGRIPTLPPFPIPHIHLRSSPSRLSHFANYSCIRIPHPLKNEKNVVSSLPSFPRKLAGQFAARVPTQLPNTADLVSVLRLIRSSRLNVPPLHDNPASHPLALIQDLPFWACSGKSEAHCPEQQ